ncbi:MAG: FtsW/RodA/SpoVE family cell cycle protein [Alistipes sp.]
MGAEKATSTPEPQQAEPSLFARIFKGDKILWITIAVLAVISILVVYSSTAKMAYDAHTARSTAKFLRDQLVILIASAGGLMGVQRFNSRVYNHLSLWIYIGFLLFTVAAYFVGHSTNGAARWISIFGFHVQPSEGLKVATILFLARQLASRQNIADKLRIVPSLFPWRWHTKEQKKIWREGMFPILFPIILSCLVIVPAHTSSALLIFGVCWVMMFIGRIKLRELFKIVGLAFVAAIFALSLNLGRSETAGGRVEDWIDLWTQDRTGIPIDQLSDTERSMIAIYNGGIFGKGAGQSDMRVAMTHPESDYAYAFFVEEYGILLAIVLLMLYVWIFFRAILIFERCGTAFPGLLVLGLALLITCQALLHIMVTINLIPETGQTLPLISRGGSSTLFTALALGMILSVSRQNKEQSHDKPKAESIYEK